MKFEETTKSISIWVIKKHKNRNSKARIFRSPTYYNRCCFASGNI